MNNPFASISKERQDATHRVASFGAGVQSTVMLLRGVRGDFGAKPDVAIFADTQWEPPNIYDHLDWVEAEVKRLSNGQIPVVRVSSGNIRQDHINGLNSIGQRFASMPLFTKGGGMGRRQCTREYKIEPIRKSIREFVGVSPRKHMPKSVLVEKWIGISTDEIERLKYAREARTVNRWPLIEANMSRFDCRSWFAKHYPDRPPLEKSACIGCPYRDNAAWRSMPQSQFDDACEFDEAIRDRGSKLRGMREQQFLHRSLLPLRTADLGALDMDDLFLGECDGMCGV